MVESIRQFVRHYRGIVVVAAVVVVGLIWWAVQNSQAAVGEAAAFHVSEAGVNYTLHLLNSGACTPAELQDQVLIKKVPDEAGTNIGQFGVEVTPLSDERWRVISRGGVGGMLGACQAVAAEVEAFSGVLGTKYRVLSWARSSYGRCDGGAETEFICGGGAP